ncbi:RDD family protein [Pedobacter polaris]|uniref:RDD family protein n=1 Tax=Pedobacter polaris TaxID=2571273 RepID=A0A4U1CXT9_9SPHI|nr:RDD family protein [Pedobacter polaris]TKC12309.1 RDD family protein [Pedobacter polaris]
MELQSSNINLEYCRASSMKRFVNYFIDATAVYIVIMFIGFLVEISNPGSLTELKRGLIEERLLGFVLYGFIMFLIETVFRGKSLGKLITGTKAINIDGSNLTLQKAILRNFIRAVPFNALSALGAPCKPWHDSWSDTIVVDEKVLNLQERKTEFFENLKNQRQ